MPNQHPPSSSERRPPATGQYGVPGSLEPQSTRVLGSPKSDRSVISDLRDLCEAVLLAPSSDGDRLAALERKVDRPPSIRPPETTTHLADELVRRIEELPAVHARVTAQLLARQPAPGADTARTVAEAAAIRELRSAHGLLDNLGCPRSDDDRPLTIIERLRWLLDVLTANQSTRAAGGRAAADPGVENTPATGVNLRRPPGTPAS